MNWSYFIGNGIITIAAIVCYGIIWLFLYSTTRGACSDAIKEEFQLSSKQKHDILEVVTQYEGDSFGLEAGILARKIREIINEEDKS